MDNLTYDISYSKQMDIIKDNPWMATSTLVNIIKDATAINNLEVLDRIPKDLIDKYQNAIKNNDESVEGVTGEIMDIFQKDIDKRKDDLTEKTKNDMEKLKNKLIYEVLYEGIK